MIPTNARVVAGAVADVTRARKLTCALAGGITAIARIASDHTSTHRPKALRRVAAGHC